MIITKKYLGGSVTAHQFLIAILYIPMKKECPKIIQKLSTHTEIIQKSSSSIQKIYNNCAKNCNASINKLLQFLAQLLYIFCMELDDFWMISVCVDNFWMIFGHSFFIGQKKD